MPELKKIIFEKHRAGGEDPISI